jgi:hypothetical protein
VNVDEQAQIQLPALSLEELIQSVSSVIGTRCG